MRRSHCRRPVVLAGFSLFMMLPGALPAQVTPVTLGETVRGTIAADDQRLADGHLYDVYSFQGEAGTVVTVTLRSEAFDSYLVLARASGVITEEVAADDDSGGGTDARIVHSLDAAGPLLVIVRGLSSEATGEYTLELGTLARRTPTLTAIRAGEIRVGELDAGDDFTDDMSFYELFTFEARAGDRVGASMRSSQFDAYLEIGHWDGTALASIGSNDDGFQDGTSDARLALTLPDDGTYAIRATSLGPQQAGQFTIALETLPALETPSGAAIRAGETLVGELTAEDALLDDGSSYDLYSYTGTAGESVTVTLRSSAFDAYLSVGEAGGPSGFSEIGADDDSAGGTDSEVTVTVPAGGTLLIRANSLSPGQFGQYTVGVRSGG